MKSKAQTFHQISLKLYQIILTPITIPFIIIQMVKQIKNLQIRTKMYTNLLYRFTPLI